MIFTNYIKKYQKSTWVGRNNGLILEGILPVTEDFTSAVAHKLAKWHRQPKTKIVETTSFTLDTTELYFPVTTLQLSNMKDTRFPLGVGA